MKRNRLVPNLLCSKKKNRTKSIGTTKAIEHLWEIAWIRLKSIRQAKIRTLVCLVNSISCVKNPVKLKTFSPGLMNQFQGAKRQTKNTSQIEVTVQLKFIESNSLQLSNKTTPTVDNIWLRKIVKRVNRISINQFQISTINSLNCFNTRIS